MIGAVLPFAAVLAVLYAVWRLVRSRLPKRPEAEPTAAPAAIAERD